MWQFVTRVFAYLFDCHHRALSRVFTIRRRTCQVQVCYDCGAAFDYSLKTMSAERVASARHASPVLVMKAQRRKYCDRAA